MGNFGHFYGVILDTLWEILDIFKGKVGHLYGEYWAIIWGILDIFMGNFGYFYGHIHIPRESFGIFVGTILVQQQEPNMDILSIRSYPHVCLPQTLPLSRSTSLCQGVSVWPILGTFRGTFSLIDTPFGHLYGENLGQ